MKPKHIFFTGILALGLMSLIGAAPRELGKLYLVVEKSTGNVIQMGNSVDSVVVEDAGAQELAVIDGEKPSNLSENYFRLVDGKLVEMNVSEKTQVDSKLQAKKEDDEVAKLKAIMARDPAGFRQILGL